MAVTIMFLILVFMMCSAYQAASLCRGDRYGAYVGLENMRSTNGQLSAGTVHCAKGAGVAAPLHKSKTARTPPWLLTHFDCGVRFHPCGERLARLDHDVFALDHVVREQSKRSERDRRCNRRRRRLAFFCVALGIAGFGQAYGRTVYRANVEKLQRQFARALSARFGCLYDAADAACPLRN